MTKKIRLIDEEQETQAPTAAPSDVSSVSVNPETDLTIKQLMKYLEAIDWKLWEMLKLMKKDAGEEDK